MNKLKPALLGGLIVGLLSAIPVVNYCCCIWGIGGGGLASFLYMKSSPTKINPGDGAMLGGLAGVIGALLYLIIDAREHLQLLKADVANLRQLEEKLSGLLQ